MTTIEFLREHFGNVFAEMPRFEEAIEALESGKGDEFFGIRLWEKGDVLSEAEALVAEALEPLLCDFCGQDVRPSGQQCWLDLNLGEPFGCVRWWRSCKPCKEKLLQIDPNGEFVVFALTQIPHSEEEWRNGWLIAQKEEDKGGGSL